MALRFCSVKLSAGAGVYAPMLFEDPASLYIHNIPPRSIARCVVATPGSDMRVGGIILVTTRHRVDKSALYRILAADLTDDDLRLYAMVCDRWALPEFAGTRWNPQHVADLLGTVRRLETRLEAAKAELAPILLSFTPET